MSQHNVIVGGTFDFLHKGHKKMLETALETGDSLIGITSDQMAKNNREREVSEFEERKNNVEKYCEELSEKTGNSYKIKEINGPAEDNTGVFSEDVEYIVISPEEKTINRVNNINSKRSKKGLEPLKIRIVDPVYSEDGKRISSTRISNGEIDKNGNIIHEGNVLILNDIHYGFFEKEDKNKKILDKFREVLQDKNTVNCIINGDLIHEESKKEDLRRFKEIWEVVESNTVNSYFSPGNHDVINLDKNDIEDIVGHELPTTFNINGKKFYIIDSASQSKYPNVGYISNKSLNLLSEIEDDSVIVSHFPYRYTRAYQKSKFFDKYPEGVFPVNKRYIDIDLNRIEKEFFAHLHLNHNYNNKPCEILAPFLNITDVESKKASITMNFKIY